MARHHFIQPSKLVTKQGCKPLPVKVNPGADINTIPLTCYKTIFPQHFTKDGHLKKNVLRSTASTWSPHDGQKKNISWDSSQLTSSTRPYPN